MIWSPATHPVMHPEEFLWAVAPGEKPAIGAQEAGWDGALDFLVLAAFNLLKSAAISDCLLPPDDLWVLAPPHGFECYAAGAALADGPPSGWSLRYLR